MGFVRRLAAALVGLLAAFASPAVAAEAPVPAAAAPPDGFYRYPTLGGGIIVFASEGDLWKVPAAGGVAMRLTAYEGEEKFPQLSPDGRLIAFTAQYEGNDDVYVMPVSGGEPRRLTYHPMPDQAIGWTEDGKVLFRSRRDHPHGDFRVYTVPAEGGIPRMIPLEPAAWISFEPKGRRMAMQKIGLEFHNWKRYKGGEAEQIYVGTLEPLAFDEVTKYEGKDAFPMWAADGRIYFATDRWGRPNLASMKPDGSDVKRLTRFDDYDVRWPSMGDGKIVYQHKMDLWIYDPATGKNAQVPIQLPSDRIQVRERFVDPMATLGAWGLSNDGERIVLETRGDLFVTRTKKKGLIRRITENSLARTKFPAFSPDGKTVAAWTEVKGEEQLLLHAADNSAPPKQVGNRGARMALPAALVARRQEDRLGRREVPAPGDRRGLGRAASSRTAGTGRSPATSGHRTAAIWPTIFAGERLQPGEGVGQRDEEEHRDQRPDVQLLLPHLGPQGEVPLFPLGSPHQSLPGPARGPLHRRQGHAAHGRGAAGRRDPPLCAARGRGPEDRGEKGRGCRVGQGQGRQKGEGQGGREEGRGEGEEGRADPDRLRRDWRPGRAGPGRPGLLLRIEGGGGKAPLPQLRGQGDDAARDGSGEDDERQEPRQTYDIEKEKVSTLAPGVLGYDVSMNGKVLVYRTKEGFFRVEAGATSAPKPDSGPGGDSRIDLGGWTVRIDPRQEWQQMLREGWRLQRDFFYDPKMHGVDWEGVWKQYGSLADRMASRDDLEDILGEMLGELNVGHAYHWPGDLRRGKPVGTGLLGADLRLRPGERFLADPEDLPRRLPVPGNVIAPCPARPQGQAGEWLVAMDGKPLVKGEDYLRRLANRAGQEVELSVNDAPKIEGARRIVVKPVGRDTLIRYATWIRENRAYVDKAEPGADRLHPPLRHEGDGAPAVRPGLPAPVEKARA